jgi:hypothetical protein
LSLFEIALKLRLALGLRLRVLLFYAFLLFFLLAFVDSLRFHSPGLFEVLLAHAVS